MRYLAIKKTNVLWTLALTILLAGYTVWANSEQVRSASGGWVTDFNEPRKLVGYADAVFVGRVIEQVNEDESHTPFPQTQFRVEVVDSIKSVKKLDSKSIESDKTKPAKLPDVVMVDQYGAHIRDNTGKRTLLLMDEQPLLIPGQTYLLVTSFDAEQNWYHVLPEGAVSIDSADKRKAILEKFKKAKNEEIFFTLKDVQGKEGDTPDSDPSTP